jgi:hypothetical protein
MLPRFKSMSETFQAVRPQPEFPAITFNRLCYSYINNDWITVISSFCTLAITAFSLLLSFNNNINIKY